jgi:hypothetical protein
MTILQHLSNTTGEGTKVPMASVAQLMNNTGYPFGYDEFKALHDSTPSIANLVSNFDKNSITLGSESDDTESDDLGGDVSPDQDAASDTVASMAKSAVHRLK